MSDLIKGILAAGGVIIAIIIVSNVCSCTRETPNYGFAHRHDARNYDPSDSSGSDRDRYRAFGDVCNREAEARSEIHGYDFTPAFSGSMESGARCHVDGGFSERGAIRSSDSF